MSEMSANRRVGGGGAEANIVFNKQESGLKAWQVKREVQEELISSDITALLVEIMGPSYRSWEFSSPYKTPEITFGGWGCKQVRWMMKILTSSLLTSL